MRGLALGLAMLALPGGFFGTGVRTADAPAAARDDTASFQAALDAGRRLSLRPLPGGACYQTYGLWVSRDRTTIDARGACIEYLGPGPVRLHSGDGDPIASDAIFFVNRSSTNAGPPQNIKISNARLVVPPGTDGYGVLVAGSNVILNNLSIEGTPFDAVTVTGRANGRGYAGPVLITKSHFVGGRRNAVSVVGAIGVTIDSNVIEGAGNASFVGATVSATGPWAGIDVEPDLLSYPVKQVTIRRNTIRSNGGAGILLALATNTGLPTVADQIVIDGNSITQNGVSGGPFLRGGICLQGGQADGNGHLGVTSNQILNNGGWGLCKHPEGFNMRITLSGNTISGNTDGDSQW